jgi:flagellin
MALASSIETRVSPSLNAYAKNARDLGDSAIRIRSGTRIVRNGDDASSLSAATLLQTQTSTLRSTLTSGARATSFLQVAADGLAKVREILTTLDELTTQANAAGQTSLRYATLDAQFQSSLRAIDTIVSATTFNGASILDGTAASGIDPYLQVGVTSSDSVSLAIPDVSTSGLFGGAVTIGSAASATAAAASVTTASDSVDNAIAKIDAYQARLRIAADAARHEIQGVTLGIDTLLATDIPAETATSDRTTLQQQTAAVLLAQAFAVNSGLLGLLG